MVTGRIVQQEDELLAGQAIFTRDVVDHLSPCNLLRKVGHTAPVREDSLQQQAALLLGPFQAMLPSKPYGTLNFGIIVGGRHRSIGVIPASIGWARGRIGAIAHRCGACCGCDIRKLEIVKAREVCGAITCRT